MTKRCPAGCGGSLVELEMRLGTGEMVTMQSCSSCDRRWWERDGQSTDIVGLIEAMSAEKASKAAAPAQPSSASDPEG